MFTEPVFVVSPGVVTGQLADMPTHGFPTCGLVSFE